MMSHMEVNKATYSAFKAHAKLQEQITKPRRNPKSDKMETKILHIVREKNDIKGKTYDEYKSIIDKKPSKAKGKDTELMKDYDMTGKNIDDEVLAFTDDLDDEEEETEKRSGEIEEEDGGDPV